MEIEFKTDWIKAGINVKEGDLLHFLDAGTIQQNRDGEDVYIFTVGIVHGGEITATKKFQPNKTNLKILVETFGNETSKWIKKEMKVSIIKVRNPSTNQLVSSILLTLPDVSESGEPL